MTKIKIGGKNYRGGFVAASTFNPRIGCNLENSWRIEKKSKSGPIIKGITSALGRG